VNHLQKSGITVLVSHMAAGAALVRFVIDVGTLGRQLRAFPGRPSFPFDAVNFLELELAREVEVPHHRFPPGLLNLAEVGMDRRLCQPQMLGNRCLGPPLDIEIGHLFSALVQGHLLRSSNRHYWTSLGIAKLGPALGQMSAQGANLWESAQTGQDAT
jgi:hypothetical protein